MLDKQQSFLATIALLDKQEKAAVNYQQRLVMNLLNSQTHLTLTIIIFSKSHHHRLINTLLRLIKNPLFELTNKLAVIQLLGKLKGQEFVLMDAALDEIESKLKSQHNEEIYQAFTLLTILIPYLNANTNFDRLLQAVQLKLADYKEKIREAALKGLTLLVPHLSPSKVSRLFQSVQLKLANNDRNVRQIALKSLGVLIPNLPPSEINPLLQQAQLKLLDNENNVREAALSCLAMLISSEPLRAVLQKIY
ncbi:hypothetical protein [Legionella busanensis]|uniref:hypothetical protein n=1 Tax=Legionella busanensis TaxID=190655 RepID=UPI001041B96E|nr:hypothetical protein [Legionella busanensis]